MIGLVWAQAANGVIGNAGALPWRIPEDLAHFRALTTGDTVLMGRATWESLPRRFRPLPDRRNLVLTRNPSYDAPGATVVTSLEHALAAAEGELWVAGGGAVYAAALALADRVVVTDVDGDWAGDVFAPLLDDSWRQTGCEPAEGWRTSSTGVRYRFRDLRRRGG